MYGLRDTYDRLPDSWFNTKEQLFAEIEALKIEDYSMTNFEILVSYSVEEFQDLY